MSCRSRHYQLWLSPSLPSMALFIVVAASYGHLHRRIRLCHCLCLRRGYSRHCCDLLTASSQIFFPHCQVRLFSSHCPLAGWMAKASASSSVQATAVTALSIHVPQNQVSRLGTLPTNACQSVAHYFEAKLLLLDAIDFSLKIQSKYGTSNKESSFKRSSLESTLEDFLAFWVHFQSILKRKNSKVFELQAHCGSEGAAWIYIIMGNGRFLSSL
ncbi:hypothetical protein LWI29_008180 [Acer saccharum]|uniref:Uncharacterized protein n=1 Tax=Acer saccharum TaxID=4024 RepID=A0AA39W846_ACESA|nr:hypothetical protein LWI29_008180 [Acer saccharum]